MSSKTIRDTSVPAIGLGTFELVGDDAIATIARAVECGYRHFDTASRYGNESDIGEGLRRSGLPREEAFITTKVWSSDCHPDTVLAAVDQSLDRLGVEQVDLLLLHWPSPEFSVKTSIEGLNKTLEAGQARHIGVSNFPPTMLLEALDYGDLFCNQVEFHPFLSQRRLLDIAEERDMLITGYAPLAIGRVASEEVLIAIGEELEKSPAQVGLRWLVDHTPVAVVPKTSSAQRLAENIDIWDFSLSPEHTAAIDQLACGLRIYDEEWVLDWEDDSRESGPPLRSVTIPSHPPHTEGIWP